MKTSPLPAPACLVDLPCQTGENPLWHSDQKRIYWTDIPACKLYRCAADGSDLECFPTSAPVGGFTFQEDGSLLLFMARGAVKLWRDGRFLETIVEEIPSERDGRFNDVIADPRGRVFCGTMSTDNHGGRFYRLDTDRTMTCLVEGMGTPNGMGFSPDRKWFYQNDSRLAVMYRWEYRQATGELSNRDVHFAADRQATLGRGRPDGLIVDAAGGLWTARWEGARIVRHQPTGEEVDDIPFPVANVSSLTLAGEDGHTAFVTTAACGNREKNGSLAGSIFRIDHLPVAGQVEFRSRIG